MKILVLLALVGAALAIRPQARSYQRKVDRLNKFLQSHPAFYKEATKDSFWSKHTPEVKKTPRNPVTNCQVNTSPSPPTSVHQLRPSDIGIVAAMGDSITAGNGVNAETIADVALQNRGESWSIGGDRTFAEGVYTLATMFHHFNPNVEGYSTGEGDVDDPNARLNVAIPGDLAEGMYEQAVDLDNKMQRTGMGWDYNNDWKVITLLIGGNDICGSCEDRDHYSAANLTARVERALDYLHANTPRALVNYNPIFDLSPLKEMSDNVACDLFQETVCPCATDDNEHDFIRQLARDWATNMRNLITSGKYDTRDDFTVVYQSHTQDATPPRLPNGDVDRSYWSPDCFHPGTKGHQAVATSLWNSMLEPVGQKRTTVNWEIATNMICPTTERPYIFTNRNSGGQANDGRAAPGQTHRKPAGGAPVHIIAPVVAVAAVALVVLVVVASVTVYKKRKASEQTAKAAGPTFSNPAYDNSA